MNLILFDLDDDLTFLPINDKRAQHMLKIIKVKKGQSLDAGLINKSYGKIVIREISDKGISFESDFNIVPEPLYPITLIIGTPRPPVAQRLLKDLTTSGVKKIIFTSTDLGEKTYLTSKLWRDELYTNYVKDGLSQGENPLMPEVERYFSVLKSLDDIPQNSDKLLLDNISPDFKISNFTPNSKEVVIAIGGERGFTDRERELFKGFGFKSFSLGNRVLRTESVCHQIVGITLTKLGLI